MPIYEFSCPHCGYKFERLQNVYDEDRTECPRCEKQADKIDSVPAPMVWGRGGTWNK